jgi:MFS family permease
VVIFFVMSGMGAFGINFQTLLPLVTKRVLLAGPSTLSLLFAVMGAGSVVAGLVAAYRAKPSRQLMLSAAACFVVLLALTGLSPWPVVTMVLLFLCGIAANLCMTSANTRLQLRVPGHLRGRVMGIYILLFIGTTPIGSYLCGQLAEHLGVRATVLIMAGLCGALVAAGWVYARRTIPAADDGSETEAAQPA